MIPADTKAYKRIAKKYREADLVAYLNRITGYGKDLTGFEIWESLNDFQFTTEDFDLSPWSDFHGGRFSILRIVDEIFCLDAYVE